MKNKIKGESGNNHHNAGGIKKTLTSLQDNLGGLFRLDELNISLEASFLPHSSAETAQVTTVQSSLREWTHSETRFVTDTVHLEKSEQCSCQPVSFPLYIIFILAEYELSASSWETFSLIDRGIPPQWGLQAQELGRRWWLSAETLWGAQVSGADGNCPGWAKKSGWRYPNNSLKAGCGTQHRYCGSIIDLFVCLFLGWLVDFVQELLIGQRIPVRFIPLARQWSRKENALRPIW